MEGNKRKIILQSYYLITPLFFLLDVILGLGIRVAIPGNSDVLLTSYYAVCFLAGFIAFKTELSAALFSLLECVINIFLLILSVFWPLLTISDSLENGMPEQFQFGGVELVHFIIVAGVLLFSFYTNPLLLQS